LLGIDNSETKLYPYIPRPDPNRRGFGFVDSEGKEVSVEN